MSEIVNILAAELMDLEGLHSQNPETGAGIDSGASYISQYTNRIFGAPYQLMDSVDRRFEEVNSHVGNEYLRNFILNSPILHIRPGMPIYTGGTDPKDLVQMIKEVYTVGSASGGGPLDYVNALLEQAAANTIFSSGSTLQRRMFGFRETYYQYMSHVNYMCRSMAVNLRLTTGEKFPPGAFTNESNEMKPFESFKWENYRMLTSVKSLLPSEYYEKLSRSTLWGAVKGILWDAGVELLGAGAEIGSSLPPQDIATFFSATVLAGASPVTALLAAGVTDLVTGGEGLQQIGETLKNTGKQYLNDVADTVEHFMTHTTTDIMVDKVSSVLFMIEPTQFEETYNNRAEPSQLAQQIDSINEGIGQELAFMTNANVDLGVADDIAKFLGNTVQTATTLLAGLAKPVTGGFVSNLLHGAMQSVKGQKMIYPKIYKSSEASRNFNFTVRLISPYGDIYNYYMNIVVPLMHLIALMAPRMVTANTVASPYLVQAFVPGMCTCDLGIISNMTITKNPDSERVSVHGFPLEVEVRFTVEELYNNLSISPSNDPASFLFNESLNDYMANMAGLQPSIDTYAKQRRTMLEALNTFFKTGEWWEDYRNNQIMKLEVRYNSATASGNG